MENKKMLLTEGRNYKVRQGIYGDYDYISIIDNFEIVARISLDDFFERYNETNEKPYFYEGEGL